MRLFALCLLIASTTALAQDPVEPEPEAKKLSIGDKAPALEVAHWIKGEPVKSFEAGTVYIIDCWATWCGPCIRAIPHMTKTQAKYKGKLRVIGVSVWEADIPKIKTFVADQGDKMGYTVATDKLPALPAGTAADSREARENASKGQTSLNWLKAAGKTGIPTCFIVDQKGLIAWIGHPARMDGPLDEIIAGKYDIKKAIEIAKAEAADAPITKELTEKLRNRQFAEAFALANKHIDTRWKNAPNVLNQIAWAIVDPKGGVKDKDLALALKAAVRANALTEGKDAAILDTLARCHFLKGDLDKALALQAKAVSHAAEGRMKTELEGVLKEYQAKKAALATEKSDESGEPDKQPVK